MPKSVTNTKQRKQKSEPNSPKLRPLRKANSFNSKKKIPKVTHKIARLPNKNSKKITKSELLAEISKQGLRTTKRPAEQDPEDFEDLRCEKKSKSSQAADTKLVAYTSTRAAIKVPCFAEDSVMHGGKDMKVLLQKGGLAEDRDSEDSEVEAGKKEALRALVSALRDLNPLQQSVKRGS